MINYLYAAVALVVVAMATKMVFMQVEIGSLSTDVMAKDMKILRLSREVEVAKFTIQSSKEKVELLKEIRIPYEKTDVNTSIGSHTIRL